MRNFNTLLLILLSLTLFLGGGCRNDLPVGPPSLDGYSLELKDASCTEAFLSLHVPADHTPQFVTLKRDTAIVFTGMVTNDTLITDENLLPRHRYEYSTTIAGRTGRLSVAAMTSDTTSHNFSYAYYLFGDQDHGSGRFYDVAVLNDTLAYAVGVIHSAKSRIYDSLGNWINPPNAARWDGKKWEEQTVMGYFGGILSYAEIRSVLAYTERDAWFGIGTAIFYWNNGPASMNTSLTGWALKMCADEDGRVYLAGSSGGLSYFDGKNWQLETSGTTMDINDIYARGGMVVAAASDIPLGKGTIIERKNGSWSPLVEGEGVNPNDIFKPKLYGITRSVWIDEKGTLYTGGNFLYQRRFGRWNYVTSLRGNSLEHWQDKEASFIYKVRGNRSNDYWIVGELNTLLHFNGVSWKQIALPRDLSSYIIWRSVDVKGNLCIAVGFYGAQPIAVVLKRS